MTHGTLTAYRLHKCRCEKCVAHASRYGKRLRYEHQHGQRRVVDSAEAHARIREMLDYGISVRAIADALGYDAPNSVWTLLRRPRMRRSTYERVMSMPMPDTTVRDSRVISAVGSRRRLQALAARGWSLVTVSERTGINVSTLCEIRNGTTQTVRQSTYVSISDVYRELENDTGTCARAMTKAIKLKWAPPMAWDEIDDPAARPQGVKR